MSILHIHEKSGGCLSFDLEHLLDLLAPQSNAAAWVVSDADGESVYTSGMSEGLLESLGQTGERISGTLFAAIARKTTQVIWGEFTGFLPAGSEQPWVVIRAIDSTYWEVVTKDQDVLDRVRSRFNDVRESDTDWPGSYVAS